MGPDGEKAQAMLRLAQRVRNARSWARLHPGASELSHPMMRLWAMPEFCDLLLDLAHRARAEALKDTAEPEVSEGG